MHTTVGSQLGAGKCVGSAASASPPLHSLHSTPFRHRAHPQLNLFSLFSKVAPVSFFYRFLLAARPGASASPALIETTFFFREVNAFNHAKRGPIERGAAGEEGQRREAAHEKEERVFRACAGESEGYEWQL